MLRIARRGGQARAVEAREDSRLVHVPLSWLVILRAVFEPEESRFEMRSFAAQRAVHLD